MNTELASRLALKGRVLTFTDSPDNYNYWETGCVIIEGGVITSVGDRKSVLIPDNALIVDYGKDLILPGFVDGHAHYPQMNVIASFGAKLIDWLNNFTFP